MDFITGLPPSKGKTTILTIVDRFSKAAHFIPLNKLPSASETVDLLVQHVVRLHGIPTDIVTDRGPQFISQVWQAFCKAVGTTSSLSSGFHPQTNGQSERANQCLENTLRCLTETHPQSWSEQLPWAEYSHNSLVNSSTGLSPFQASLGYQPPLFPSQEAEIAVPSVQDHLHRCQAIWNDTREALLRSQQSIQLTANRRRRPSPQYTPGQSVWLSTKNIPLQVESRKLAPRYIGPFTIDKIVNPSAVRLNLPNNMRIHPTFHVSQIKPVNSCSLSLLTTFGCWTSAFWITDFGRFACANLFLFLFFPSALPSHSSSQPRSATRLSPCFCSFFSPADSFTSSSTDPSPSPC